MIGIKDVPCIKKEDYTLYSTRASNNTTVIKNRYRDAESPALTLTQIVDANILRDPFL